VTRVFIRGNKGQTQKRGEGCMQTDGRNSIFKTKNTWNHQKMEEAKKDSFLEPLQGAWPSQHTLIADSDLRIVRE
jgi:hypothetical protein